MIYIKYTYRGFLKIAHVYKHMHIHYIFVIISIWD